MITERSQTREVSEIVSSSNPNMCVVTSNPNPAKSTTSELQQEHDEVTSPSINYSEEIVIDYELVQIEIRYALLVSICIISSLVTLIMELGLIMFSPPHQVDHYTNMAFLLVSLDIFINSLCLCLLYDKDKSSVIYDKVCTICHSQCRSWRIRHIMNQQGLSDDNTSVQFKNLMTKE